MKTNTPLLLLLLLFFSCQEKSNDHHFVITQDINNFWEAFDKVVSATDTSEQATYLKELFFEKASPGLEAIMQVRNYTENDYLDAINTYPKFWNSIRTNTLKSASLRKELESGVEKLRQLYPDLRPAKIYFTIGALRTNGTTRDSLVLIGSELAMTDQNTDVSEFPEEVRGFRKRFFDTNPIENLVLLNVHEFVHTQQNPIPNNLLGQCIYEGVAEFISVKAMDVPSSTPAVHFGKKNEAPVKAKFEGDMFKGNKRPEWLWSDAENGFDMRDLGYYIGFEICERFYEQADDKKEAIKTMIELDYSNQKQIEAFVDGTGFFTKPIHELRAEFQLLQPTVLSIKPFENGSRQVDPNLTYIEVEFSKEMNQVARNFEMGPLGADHVVRFKKEIGYSEDGKNYSFEINKLEPNKPYQIVIGTGFMDKDGRPLKEPYLIDFKTSD